MAVPCSYSRPQPRKTPETWHFCFTSQKNVYCFNSWEEQRNWLTHFKRYSGPKKVADVLFYCGGCFIISILSPRVFKSLECNPINWGPGDGVGNALLEDPWSHIISRDLGEFPYNVFLHIWCFQYENQVRFTFVREGGILFYRMITVILPVMSGYPKHLLRILKYGLLTEDDKYITEKLLSYFISKLWPRTKQMRR